MCISNYFEDKENKIKALETYRQKLKVEEKETNINNFLFLQHITEVIRKEKETQSKGAAIISSISDPIARQLLTYKYIDGKTWESIADIMNYSNTHIYRIRRRALELFEIAEAEAV